MRHIFFILALLFSADVAFGQLQTWPDWVTQAPYIAKQVPPQAVVMRGIGTDEYYVVEVDPATGAIPVTIPAGAPLPVTVLGKTYVDSVRNVYSVTNVTAGAWVQLIASTADDINALTIFDSSGQTLELGIGAAASESRVLIIPPGGIDGTTPLRIDSGTRVSVRAISGTASVGELNITGIN